MRLVPRCGLAVVALVQLAGAPEGAFAAEPAVHAKPMNVIFILCDDLNARLNCYGYKDVKTPHLDRLAAEGMRFDHAYCQYPVCNPTRSSLLTGLRPETTKVLSNNTPLRKMLPNAVTLPQCFKQQGYWTASVNKFFHDPDNDGDLSWNEHPKLGDARNPVTEKARAEFEAKNGPINDEKNRKAWREKQRELRDLAGGQTPPGYGPTDMTDEEMADGKGARQVIKWLETKAYGDKPFFIGWGVARPHIPHWTPQKYYDMYPLDKFQFEPQPADDWKDIPEIAFNPRYKLYGDPFNNDRIRREYTQAYYACVTYIDAQVGLLMEALKRLGLADNTIIVFTGDHGYLLGEHRLWEKAMLFEEVARVPLLVKVPGKTKPNSVSPRLVEFVDLYPSLAELCGVKPPDDLEGTSFVPLLSQPDRAWKRGAFTIVERGGGLIGRTVRSERFRYTEWGSPDVCELYDLVEDPHSFTNLAKDPKYAKQIEEMRSLLHGGWKEARPPAISSDARPPKNEADLRFWLENMVDWHGFSDAEVSAATGLPETEIHPLLARLGMTAASRPGRPMDAPLHVLPYPGGRHPRIGFLEGAVRPQRETKISAFTPWDPSSYVVVDVPEAIWWGKELLYLAHEHRPTIWTERQVVLEPLEWNRHAGGVLDIERKLPNGVRFGARVRSATGAVHMELWLTNGTDQPLADLRAQICVLCKGAKGFQQQTNENKVFAAPYAACRSQDGRHWIITAWQPCHNVWGNPPCPCFHSNAKLGTCPPGQTRQARGFLSFYEGTDIQAEFRRIEQAGWLEAT